MGIFLGVRPQASYADPGLGAHPMTLYRFTIVVSCAAAVAAAACTQSPARVLARASAGALVSSTSGDLDASFATHTTGAVVPSSPANEATQSPDSSSADPACPSGMLLVEGEYCPQVEQKCLSWMDPPESAYAYFRCAKYAQPATCRGPRVHRRFCIDQTERLEPGTDLPMNKKSWTDGKHVCEADGARLCMTSEWQFACEGEEMRPYPYGWERDATACNVDVMTGLGKVGRLVDHRAPASAHPRCVSPFGVHDMAGNVDEWATVDGAPRGSREVMKGSWWLPGRHACRSFQGGHGAYYGGTESGVRCCKDALPPELAKR